MTPTIWGVQFRFQLRGPRFVVPIAGALLSATIAMSTRSWLSTWLQVALIIVGATTLFCYLSVPRADPDTAPKIGVLSAALHLATTTLCSTAYAWFMYDGYAGGSATGDAVKDFMLSVGLLGGMLALFRSSGTHALTQAVLEQNTALKSTTDAMRKALDAIVPLNVSEARTAEARNLFDLALTARMAADAIVLTEIATQMVALAVRLPEISDEIDALSLWVRSEKNETWGILAQEGISEETAQNFRQSLLDKEHDGAGMVANMAVTDTDIVISPDVTKHGWYMQDPYSVRKAAGLAAVLIRNVGGSPVAAVCATSEEPGVIPAETSVEGSALKKTLLLWQAAFTLIIGRLLELEAQNG